MEKHEIEAIVRESDLQARAAMLDCMETFMRLKDYDSAKFMRDCARKLGDNSQPLPGV